MRLALYGTVDFPWHLGPIHHSVRKDGKLPRTCSGITILFVEFNSRIMYRYLALVPSTECHKEVHFANTYFPLGYYSLWISRLKCPPSSGIVLGLDHYYPLDWFPHRWSSTHSWGSLLIICHQTNYFILFYLIPIVEILKAPYIFIEPITRLSL